MHTYVGTWVENRLLSCLDSSETDNNHINQENTQQIWAVRRSLTLNTMTQNAHHETGTEQK